MSSFQLHKGVQRWVGDLNRLYRSEAAHVPFHGQPYSLNVTFPPLAVMFFKNEEK